MGLLSLAAHVGVAQTIFSSFPEDSVPYVAACSVYLGEGEPRVLLLRHLELESPLQYFRVCLFTTCMLMAQFVPSLSGGWTFLAALLSFFVASLGLLFHCSGSKKGSETHRQ